MEGDAYERAAAALLAADYLLIATGAGFSADSALPVYSDIADDPAYHAAGLAYDDLCRAALLQEDAARFYGFWGQCYNLYKEARPHDGYAILARWCRSLNERLVGAPAAPPLPASGQRHYVYTSNVDGHHRRGDDSDDTLIEIHGCLDHWVPVPPAGAPTRGGAAAYTFTPAASFRFNVDPDTKRILQGDTDRAEGRAAAGTATQPSTEVAPAPPAPSATFSSQPRTDTGEPLRPAVMMFDDEDLDVIPGLRDAMERYQAWEHTAECAVVAGEGRLVILELGCGVRCPSVRTECEDVLLDCLRGRGALPAEFRDEAAPAGVDDAQHFSRVAIRRWLETGTISPQASPARGELDEGVAAGARRASGGSLPPPALLIRVNLDTPECAQIPPPFAIPIRERALTALKKMDEAMERLRQGGGTN